MPIIFDNIDYKLSAAIKSMLSILLPIYNFNVIELVNTLRQQCESNQIEFEILCFDDYSKASFRKENKFIRQLSKVHYKELPENLGRAKIRNLLGQTAKYDYLLFLDCDSKITNKNYIKNYIEKLQPKTLLYGGRKYPPLPPSNSQYLLHYYFGKNREETLTEENKISPYYSFMSNNFVISRSLFLSILFDKHIDSYGHEDTLFGLELQKKQIQIVHLENSVEHLGLEKREQFLTKQKQAIANLYQLHQKEPLLETKLLQTFVWCKKWKMKSLVFFILDFLYPFIFKRLKAKRPRLLFLDLYKLHYLLKIDQSKNEPYTLPS